jgi:uncharacterized metal-binding protein
VKKILRPLPVLYACSGCPEFGWAAREAGADLERRGSAQLVWLGTVAPPKLAERFPILALDGCAKGCALAWLARHGIAPEQHYVLPEDAERLRAAG